MVDILSIEPGSVKTDEPSPLMDSGRVDYNAMVARNIRRYREERNLSLGELARRADVSKQTLSKIEIGTGNPTVGTIGAIADALGLSVRAILTEWGSPIRIGRADDAEWVSNGLGTAERMLDTIYGSGDVRTWLLRLGTGVSSSTSNTAILHCKPSAAGTLHHCYVVSGTARIGPANEPIDVQAGDFVRFPGDVKHMFQSTSGDALLHVVTTVPGVPQFRPVRDESR